MKRRISRGGKKKGRKKKKAHEGICYIKLLSFSVLFPQEGEAPTVLVGVRKEGERGGRRR